MKSSNSFDGDDYARIQSYGVTELGQLYSPNLTPASAGRTLRRWIDYNTALHSALYDCGWDKKQRKFTPLQVKQIFQFLGEP